MSKSEPFHLLLDAITFASHAHRHQLRKDGQTPYISHPYRVVMILRHVFGVEDERVLSAAVLHDTIEDTTTDYDDLRKRFGAEVAGWVAALSKDTRLPEERREPLFLETLAQSPDAVKLIKLADLYDNTVDSRATLSAEKQARHVERAREFIKRLQKDGASGAVSAAADKLSRLLLSPAGS